MDTGSGMDMSGPIGACDIFVAKGRFDEFFRRQQELNFGASLDYVLAEGKRLYKGEDPDNIDEDMMVAISSPEGFKFVRLHETFNFQVSAKRTGITNSNAHFDNNGKVVFSGPKVEIPVYVC